MNRKMATVSSRGLPGPAWRDRLLMTIGCLGLVVLIPGCAKVHVISSQDADQEVTCGSACPCDQKQPTTTITQHPIPCPPVPSHDGSLELEDPDLGPWMMINNSFTNLERFLEEDEIWYGVLIQLGRWVNPLADESDEDTDGDELPREFGVFHHVDIDGVVYGLTEEDEIPFEWINIVPASDTREAPLPFEDTSDVQTSEWEGDPRFLTDFYPNEDTDYRCYEFDKLTEDSCKSENRQYCLRLRSLHAFFTPEAVITYWAGTNGYDLAVLGEPQHPRQVFRFKDPVDVYVHIKEESAAGVVERRVEKYAGVQKVEVVHEGGITHGSHHDPPMGDR